MLLNWSIKTTRDVAGLIRYLSQTAHRGKNIHASSTARNLAPLLQAVNLAATVRLVLALHVVVVEGLAPVANEVGCTEQGCRCGANLLDLGDVVRHGGGVHQDMLVETGGMVSPGSFWRDRGVGMGRFGGTIGRRGVLPSISLGHGDGVVWRDWGRCN